MKTKQTIRDSRDVNDEQASAQHTLNKKTKHEVDESVAESFVVQASERRVRLRLHALFPFVLFSSCKSTDALYTVFSFSFFSLSLSFFLGQKKKEKKKTTHPLLLLLYPLCSTLDTAPGQVLYGKNNVPPSWSPRKFRISVKLPSMGFFTQRKKKFNSSTAFFFFSLFF